MDAAIAIRIPQEIKHNILSFCPKSSCASLARVHTSYQGEAERAIYRSIGHSIHDHTKVVNTKILGCLETLSTNREKASMVRSLALWFDRISSWTDENRRAAILLLLNALTNMHSLSDLRMRISLHDRDPVHEQFNSVLRGNHFCLQTLYCDSVFDLVKILEDQPTLQFFGIYANDNEEDTKKILDSLQARRLRLPMVSTLYNISDHFYQLDIFPVFYPDHINICGALKHSYNQGQSIATDTSPCNTDIAVVKIYLKDFSDMVHIRRIVENMVCAFPGISILEFSLQHPDQFDVKHPKIKDILSLVPDLEDVQFSCWEEVEKPQRYGHSEEVNWEQAKEWGSIFPKLLSISFLSGLSLERRDEGSVWAFER
ncbi:hypothetical protein GALMADRAFT_241672 [Galerina marginata CBS 339.88]|uniref:F-box domain-containing protein n=1 Tax=Galerina marginata (strain CBS 339.88) TaxID=685588 RepID=A0A067TFD1_GALM3|nr:hypothetical protein GALMADRAFT_241672 [Galerina marginata CBS 339.88]